MSRHAGIAGLFLVLCGSVATTLLISAKTSSAAAPPPSIQGAVSRGLPLLIKGAKGHIAKRDCFACHNQTQTVMALTIAREHGFTVKLNDVQEQLEHIASFLDKNRDNYRKGRGQGGQVDTAGYALLTLEWGGWKADATTAAIVEYLLLYRKDLDHWTPPGNRPPSEGSPFTTTYLALRALRKWGLPEHRERIDKRIDTVRGWLRKTSPLDTEERVFRLLSLREAGAPDREVNAAARDLLKTQRHDGGWSQIDRMDGDAYATGSALVALHLSGGLSIRDQEYQRGVAFLMRTQLADGSWLVRLRSHPFQTYYESGFPHGKNQFISMAASGWAVSALALACPKR